MDWIKFRYDLHLSKYKILNNNGLWCGHLSFSSMKNKKKCWMKKNLRSVIFSPTFIDGNYGRLIRSLCYRLYDILVFYIKRKKTEGKFLVKRTPVKMSVFFSVTSSELLKWNVVLWSINYNDLICHYFQWYWFGGCWKMAVSPSAHFRESFARWRNNQATSCQSPR